MSDARRFVITVDGRRHEVVVDPPSGDTPRSVRVDGQPQLVTTAAGGDRLVRDGESGTQTRVSLPSSATPRWAATPGQAHPIEVRTARQAARDEAEAAARGDGSGGATIEAPMPGRVVKILVEVGAVVEHDAPLIIVEAMKMENEVRAPVAGRVATLSVAAGDTVDPGQVMCVLEPEPEA